MKAKLKPIVIDFFPISEDFNSVNDIKDFLDWIESFDDKFTDHFYVSLPNEKFEVSLRKGHKNPVFFKISTNNIVIRDYDGKYYLSTKEEFYNNYEVL